MAQDEDSSPHPQEQNPDPPRQEVIASDGATIKDVVQAIISGKVEGDVVFGDKIYVRSEVEELNDYLAWAVAEFENRMSQLRLDPAQPDKPFKSLDYFTPEDASIFFGRKTATGELLDKVVGSRIMILYGRSGAGKSSILNAGLCPQLLKDSRLPVYVRVHPFEADLVQEIKRAMFPPSLKPWPRLLEELTLHEFLGLACTHRNRRTRELVVILDQFEQFLISLPDAKIRVPFIETLRDCYEDRTLAARFVISLKHENLGDLDEFEKYIPLILQNRYSLPPMSEAEVKEAITGPVQAIGKGISFEPALLEELVKELGGDNVELTHLQIVCNELYEALPEGQQVITTDLYQELGKVDKILSTYLDKTLEPLPEYKHKVARLILMELVSSEGTNRILRLPDFMRVIPPEPSVLEDVLQYLINNRLLRRGTAPEEKEYELAHAYLAEEISHWIGKDQLENKKAQDLLQRELVNWHLFQVVVNPQELNIFKGHITYLSLDENAREMLFYSSLEHGHDVDFWIGQTTDKNAAARQAATFAVGNEKIAEQLKSGLTKDLQPDVLSALWQIYNRPGSTQKRQAAETLWILRDWLSPKEVSQLRLFLLPVWTRRNVQHNARPLLVMAVFGIPLLAWFFFIRERPVPGKWIEIPGGSFVMGMDATEAKYANEFCMDSATETKYCDKPDELLFWFGRKTSATLKQYSILDNEVTFAQYQQCVDEGKCKAATNTPEDQRAINLPATNLTWLQAEAYCEWLGGRLPTEAEWEKAARGPKGNYFPWGNDTTNWDPNRLNIEHENVGSAQPVFQFAETDLSVYGIKNMAGNVQEWTATEFRPDLIMIPAEQKFSDPVLSSAEARARIEQAKKDYPPTEDEPKRDFNHYPVVMVRGGSWDSNRAMAFASQRSSVNIEAPLQQIGFRCACPAGATCNSPWDGWWIWLGLH